VDIVNHLGEINWLAVVAASVAAFFLGALWYSNRCFGTRWMQEIGLTEGSANKGRLTRTFIATFILQLIAATALAVFIGAESDWLGGLHTGALVGLLWIATAYAITYIFEQRSMRLFLINAGFYVVQFAIMGSILGGWR